MSGHYRLHFSLGVRHFCDKASPAGQPLGFVGQARRELVVTRLSLIPDLGFLVV